MGAIGGQGGVHIHTAGVRKCRFLQSASHGDVKCYARFWNCTPSALSAG